MIIVLWLFNILNNSIFRVNMVIFMLIQYLGLIWQFLIVLQYSRLIWIFMVIQYSGLIWYFLW